MAIVTTHRRRQPSLLDPEPPPPGGFVPPAGREATRTGPRALRAPVDRELTPAVPAEPARGPSAGGAAATPLAASPHRETLEDLIAATWGGLLASHAAACPMCGGDLAPRYSAGARPVGGRCRSCGTELS